MPTKTSKKADLIDESAIIATTTFELKKFEMKGDDLQWRMKLELKTRLNHTFREYNVRFSVNEKPFEIRIEDLERRKQMIQDEVQMAIDDGSPASNRKQQIKNIDLEIDQVRAELEQMIADLPVMSFDGVIEKLEYKYGDTVVTMMFPSEALAELNTQRGMLPHYKIELIRE